MRHYGGSHPYTPKRAVPVNHFELGSSGAAGQVRMASEIQPATAAATCAVAMSLILAPILAPAFVSQPIYPNERLPHVARPREAGVDSAAQISLGKIPIESRVRGPAREGLGR